MATQNKLAQLRALMSQHQLDYYYVPASDAHHNEYVPAAWQRRAYISGFTGSAGDALIGKDHAWLWTDGRYVLQAQTQLDDRAFTLIPAAQGSSTVIAQWLIQQKPNARIGVDPQVINYRTVRNWETLFQTQHHTLVSIQPNLIDEIWEEQPALPTHPILRLAQQYTGATIDDKLAQLRAHHQNLGVDSEVICALDAIAWLLNIRGQDIDYNPLVISYAIITANNVQLFMHTAVLTDENKAYFNAHDIEVLEYDTFADRLHQLSGRVLTDPALTNWWVIEQLKHADIVANASPTTLLKAIKNTTEQRGMAEAHRLDALAMCRFLAWLEQHWVGQTELSAATQLEQFRRTQPECVDLSFNTISGFGPHGAIVHYAVDTESDIPITDQNLYLLDSGGQYYSGTTDITRTIHLGKPTDAQRRHYTLVLKGHLALRHCPFPAGTTGEALNAIARQPLWMAGLDFAHGTGHGVGCYLCVHEGPQRISSGYTGVALEPGMVVSNEPGLYFENEYGIRIENLCLVVNTDKKPFYGLDDLTLVPYARNLIDTTLLSAQEIEWINSYHQRIYKTLAADLGLETQKWLAAATALIDNLI